MNYSHGQQAKATGHFSFLRFFATWCWWQLDLPISVEKLCGRADLRCGGMLHEGECIAQSMHAGGLQGGTCNNEIDKKTQTD